MTIGEKIKLARTLSDLTQKQLGIMTNLSDARIRQYELGIRNPKPEQLTSIASALNVPIEFFHDRRIDSDLEIMHALFEIDNSRNIRIHQLSSETGDVTEYAISFNSITLNNYLNAWKKEKEQLNSVDYEKWKLHFPNDILNTMNKVLKAKRKELSGE